MKNPLNKIIIPNTGKVSLSSKKSKEEILKNLSEISTEEIGSIGEEINTSLENKSNQHKNHDDNELKRNKECSAEHALMVREFLLRLGFSILHIDPIVIAGNPIHICQKGDEIFVYDEFEQIGRNISGVYGLKDTNSDTTEGVIEVKGKPALVVKMGNEDIIIRGKDQIDAGIFFRNHKKDEPYTVQEITNFLENLN